MLTALTGCFAVLSLAAADPAADQGADIVATATGSGSLGTLVRAVQAAGLDEVLRREGPFTLFAPSDAAFAQLPSSTLELLLDPVNRPTLVSILQHHVVAGRFDAASALEAGRVTTLAGTTLPVTIVDGRVEVAAAKMIENDVESSNGVIHVIGSVLLPQMTAATSLIDGSAVGVIEAAIARGVPLFNAGGEAACAAIYEVAALALLRAEEVPADARSRIGAALRQARTERPHAAAWTLRRVLDRTYRDISGSDDKQDEPRQANGGDDGEAATLFDFDSRFDVAAWRSLNDTVMGGRSSSRMQQRRDGVATFSGTTSLENNGGFASVRATVEPGALAGRSGIALRVRGDGRSYRLLVGSDRLSRRGNYDYEFSTVAGSWVTVKIPFDQMRLNIRGRRPAAPPPTGEDIDTIGLLIGDKRAGNFELDVDWIRPYR